MPLVKRTVTPARLAANRRAARKSTGPRTAEGKSRSSLNAFRDGCRSKTLDLLLRVLAEAAPGGVLRMASQKMTAAQRSLPNVASILDVFRTNGDLRITETATGRRFAVSEAKTQSRISQSKPKSAVEPTNASRLNMFRSSLGIVERSRARDFAVSKRKTQSRISQSKPKTAAKSTKPSVSPRLSAVRGAKTRSRIAQTKPKSPVKSTKASFPPRLSAL